LFLVLRKRLFFSFSDPFYFVFVFTYGTGYGLIIALTFLGKITSITFFWVMINNIVFLVALLYFLPKKIYLLKTSSRFLSQRENGAVFFVVLFVYLLLLVLILKNVGLGMFAESNRFEQNRGYGFLVRILEPCKLFIVSYFSIKIAIHKKSTKLLSFLFFIFILFNAILGGAKADLLYLIYAVYISRSIYGKKIQLKRSTLIVIGSAILGFALIVLSINIANNSMKGVFSSGSLKNTSIVFQYLLSRILGNGDMYYLGLPGDVYKLIGTDNILIRFLSPIVGISVLSQLLGYDVGLYSVGKQILLFWSPGRTIAGGPVSHFDLFGLVYLGDFGSLFFSFALGLICVGIYRYSLGNEGNIFKSSIATTIILRGLAIIIEPPVGVAYLLDIFLFVVFCRLSGFIILYALKDKK
jgi:hypothetical protein